MSHDDAIKQDELQPAIKGDSKLAPAEIRLYATHWAEILQEMNRILAQEED